MIHAGFYVADITPPVGASIPGGFAPRAAEAVHDPLRVRAGVFATDDGALAFVGVDAVSLKTEDMARAREMAAALSPVPAANIIIAASHTHTGGPANDVLGTASEDHHRRQIVNQIASAVAEAARRAVPAEIAWASGTAHELAWNRRWILADGSQATHSDPADDDVIERAGPSDPEVLLLAARDLAGRPLGLVGNFTCHVTIMGGSHFSADYPGAWSDMMQTATGAPLVFLNGAMGDLTQVNREAGFDRPQKGDEGVQRFARKLTGESLKLLAEMEFSGEAAIATAGETLGLDFRTPTEEQLERDRQTIAAVAEDDYSREAVFARERVLLAEHIAAVGREPCPVTCARIAGDGGELAIASGAGQMFCEFGLDCKARSPFEHTMYVSLANGNVGYVPTPAAIAGGGYEPTLCRGSKLVPEAGGLIVDAQVRLLEALR
ncbi:MAG: hypothetical protein ACOX9R_10835 [Armatimonadota bacterium]|jgi:neutral ceramidase